VTRTRAAALARRAGVLLALVLAAAALDFVFRDLSWSGLRAALTHQPPGRIAACLALTAASFACLALYDLVGVRVAAPGRVPARLALLAGATSAAIANTLGFHAVSGSAVRAHLYLPAGLSGAEVARVVSMSWLSLLAGNMTMLAGAELFQACTGVDPAWHAALGVGLEALLLLCLWWLSRGAREVALGRFRLPLPPAPLAWCLMLLGAVESGTAIGALYVLLPADLAPPFDAFAVGCIAAVVLGVVAHVPGGLGVFEAGMTAILGGRGRPDLIAALLLYRLLYNLLPFALAAATLGMRTAWKSFAGRTGQQPASQEP
jgi:phosphatidylglycerol lysyltransferase